jgi:sterol desaturase/sphingolipid hydroxylase (fatty acid hydroxylase superfamily)
MIFPQPSEQSPPIFKWRWLDTLTRTPWWVVPLVYVPACAWLVYVAVAQTGAGAFAIAILAAAGFVTWTLVEYWLHRTLFHWEPKTSWGPTMHFFLHGVHHEQPHDPYRLVMPLPVSLVLFLVFLVLWTALLGHSGWAFHAGFVLGYVVYDVTHYAIHHSRFRPGWLKSLRRHHLSHHFNSRYGDRRFGVSTDFWDRFFRMDRPVGG